MQTQCSYLHWDLIRLSWLFIYFMDGMVPTILYFSKSRWSFKCPFQRNLDCISRFADQLLQLMVASHLVVRSTPSPHWHVSSRLQTP